jgi:hypothetical protein
MSRKYEIGEVFRYNNKTYMCVDDSSDHGVACAFCALFERERELCKQTICRRAHFEEVHEPRERMLFRASDGNMYQFFLDNDPYECPICACDDLACLDCDTITNEAFPGYSNMGDGHWLLLYRGEPKEHKCESKKVDKMERYLELHVTRVDDNEVSFKINRQYHRGDEFCTAGKKFEASNGMLLISESVPGFFVSDDKLVFTVCGVIPECDNTTLTVTHKQFALIMQAINEYNETNGAGYEKPWPQAGDEFYRVDADGSVRKDTFKDIYDYYKTVRKIGNCFKTKKEAKAMAEKFKSMLKGE